MTLSAAVRYRDGSLIPLEQREPPQIVAAVELPHPQSEFAEGHNGAVLRVMGWATSATGSSPVVRVRLGRRTYFEGFPTQDRPDVIADLLTLGHECRLQCGFDIYIPIRNRRRPCDLTVEVYDNEVMANPFRFRFEPQRRGSCDTYQSDSPEKLRLAAQWLQGRGLEFGALHLPFFLDRDKVSMSYADHVTKENALKLFPELKDNYSDDLVEPNFIVDLNDDFSFLSSEDFDFYIANDVIEHLANPLHFLKSVHDIMKPKSRFLLSLPDREFAFDTLRRKTTYRHIRDEFHQGVSQVSVAHIDEYIANTDTSHDPEMSLADKRIWHRNRSIHVHVWDQSSFDRLLRKSSRQLKLEWDIVGQLVSSSAGGSMTYIFERR